MTMSKMSVCLGGAFVKNVLLSVAVAVAILPMGVSAVGTYYVSPTGDDGNAGTSSAPFKTIQKALDSIVGDASWKSKIMIEAGTYKIDSELKPTSGTYEFTIQSVSGDPSDVTIDAQGLCRCFNSTGATILTFNGITFINGSASGDGGGVLSPYTSTFENCVISNCTATGKGGGICVSGGQNGFRRLNNVLIQGCSATSDGGGIYVNCYDGAAFTASEGMSNCRIYNCSAGARGGGVFILATKLSTISDCDISCNTASGAAGGGGIYAKNTAISDCTVTNNVCDYANTSTAGTGGSGIRLDTYGTIDGCLIKGNSFTYNCSSYNGGGTAVYLANGSSLVNSAIIGNSGARSVGLQWANCGGILVSNCLFKSNVARQTAGNGRGGILSLYGLNADSLITDCRFLDNQAASHGGLVEMHMSSGSGDATLCIRNCLISGNVQTGGNGLVWANSSTSASARRIALENCTIVSNTIPSAPVICPYVENANYTATNFVSVSGCAILFNNGKAAFYNNYKASAKVACNCTELTGMSEGNITYDSSRPLFEDLANGNFRPATGSQLRDVVPAAAWMGDGGKNSRSRDLGTGYELKTAGTYGVDVVWTDAMPRLSGNAADIGCMEYWRPRGFIISFR